MNSRRRKFAALVLAGGLFATPAGAVTYGDFVDSPQIQYPEVVPVWVGGSLCTGTLIEQQIALTAAHCVYGRSGPIQIAVGGSTLNSGRLVDVTATWYHPRYDASFLQNDIALLHLKEPAGVSRLASLPSPNTKKPKRFTMAGWGRDQNGLLTGKLSAINLNEYGEAAAKAFKGEYNPRTMIGAGRFFPNEALFGGGCQGDSGGPLYRGRGGSMRVVVGVTSWGAEGCIRYKPTIYTWVSYYVPELLVAITQVKTRAIQSPIPTGKATPAGLGPTTTVVTSTTARSTTTSVAQARVTPVQSSSTTVARTITTTTIPNPTTTIPTDASIGTGQLSVSVFPACTGCQPQVPSSNAAVLNVSASAIAFNWGFGNILGTSLQDGALINFRGFLKPTVAGTYRLCGYSDDGFMLDLDGIRVINDWIDRDKAWINCDTAKYATPATVDFSDGRAKQLNAWYYENRGEALVYLWYFTANGWTVVPTNWYVSG